VVGAVGFSETVLPSGRFALGDGEGGGIPAEVALHGADDLALEGCGQQVGTRGLGEEGGVGERGGDPVRISFAVRGSQEERQTEEEGTGTHRTWGVGSGFNLVWVDWGKNAVELRILQRIAVDSV